MKLRSGSSWCSRLGGGAAILALAVLLAPLGGGAEEPSEALHEKELGPPKRVSRLSEGDPALASVRCYQRVRQEAFLPDEQAIELCQFATTEDPAECFIQARRQTFLDEVQLIRLCRPLTSQLLRPCPLGF